MYDAHPSRRRELMSGVIERLAAGRINPRIAVRLPLSSAADAHRMIEAGGGLGKIILIP
jgi:NADPH2:quinone reductase